MKVFILADDLSGNGPVWLSIVWPLYNAFAESIDTTYLPIPPVSTRRSNRIAQRVDEWRQFERRRSQLVRRVESDLDSNGPNLLVVLASSGRNLKWSRALEPVWHRFSRRILHVNDTLQVKWVADTMLDRFDLVTCFCKDLADQYAERSAAPVLFWPAHVDTLGFHCADPFRPIDLIVVGRRLEALHRPLHRHFNEPGRHRIFLDFVTRTQGDRTCEEEFRLLMATYGRSAAAFCYEPSHVGRFEGSSPLLARWVHAWAAGCTVFGSRPTGPGTAGLMDWPESTIELPIEPEAAIETVEAVLADEQGMMARRVRNVQEAMRRHDTRYRIELMLRTVGIDPPEPLVRRIEMLEPLAQSIGTGLPTQNLSARSDAR